MKLSSSDTVRVWRAPILARGELHIELLLDAFPGETEEGAELMVGRVRAALNIRFQGASPPKLLFTDRGNGFYNSGTGKITARYKAALREHGLKAFFGADAAVHLGQLQEVMLHETAVWWMRVRLAQTLPKKAWEETTAAYASRLKACASYINDHHNVEGLCKALPGRLELLRATGRSHVQMKICCAVSKHRHQQDRR